MSSLLRGVFITALVSSAACSSEESTTPAGDNGSSGEQTPTPGSTGKPKPPDLGPVDDPSGEPPPPPWADDPNAPPCTGAPGELYELKVRQLAGVTDIPMCRFKGYVLLILNGASYCGQTYQYEPLQLLYSHYKDQKFVVLAFPSKSFNQEKDTDAEVSSFCTDTYHIQFPLFSIDNVAKDKPNPGDVPQPVFQWLITQPQPTYAATDPRSKDPLFATQVPWNFEKFLISREGKLVRRFNYSTSPWPTWDPSGKGVATPADQGGNGTTNVVDDAIQVEIAKP